MGALCLGLAALATLHIRDLLQAPVVLLDLPTRLGKFQPPQFIHFQFVGSPVLRSTVLGHEPEHLHHAIVLWMDHRAGWRDVTIPHRPIPCPVRVHPPVMLEPSQPASPDRIEPFEVYKAAVTAVKKHIFLLESALHGRVDQVPEMVVLCLGTLGFS